MLQELQKRAKPNSIHVIVNPASGKRVPLIQTLNDILRPAGIRFDVSVTHDFGDGAVAVRKAVEQGADLVACYGGDGTVMDVSEGLLDSSVPLLILQGGTGNLVAKELDLPKELTKSLQRITGDTLSTRRLDVGHLGKHPFLLRAGCGFETDVLQDASRELKNQFGKWAYAFAAAKALQEVSAAKYRITIDDKSEVFAEAVACVIANTGAFGVGSLSLSPGIEIDDGKLDLILIRQADVEGIFSLIRMMMGDEPKGGDAPVIDASHLVGRWQATKVRIETDPVLPIQVDGDVLTETPQTAEILPGALEVVV
ncbi:MAG: diacylglycerol kinase family protein [Verrucomicrobiota bacterium]